MQAERGSVEAKGNVTALTIAGFDPGSGAGITADLLTFARYGVFAASALTALTVQTTRGVSRVDPVDPILLRDTLQALEGDLPPSGVKIGMLGGAEHVRTVARYLADVQQRRQLPVVLDPVLTSTSGTELTARNALLALQDELLPLVSAITPNAPEAEALTSYPCRTRGEAEACARALQERYVGLVVVLTGGHMETPDDLLFEGGAARWFPGQRLQTRATHGTGCVFSSALLAERLHGCNWPQAAAGAKAFVRTGMATAVERGQGRGPLNLLCPGERT